ncbi:O-antigen ligase family protein [Halorubrum ezzemoulense]|uniref:O-antigen ligase family protein n=1 Tax=Halorubrum ezzemoulense TaxID=337243 RepID=UPI00232EC1DF|nr:O-antigen ligase family protein [Halorubrum ezzemoulense]MDB9235813.1 O-antigen ligase family protein [Halorubrum ezzemoulense]
MSAFLVIIGIPTLAMESYSLGPIEITPWLYEFNLPPNLISGDINPIRSIFRIPNTLGLIASIGFFSSLGLTITAATKIRISFTILNFLGAYLNGSRSAFIFTLIGLVIFFVAIYLKCPISTFAVQSIFCSIFLPLIVFSIRPSLIPQFIDLTGRRTLWEASINAIKTNPLLGFGAGDQSAYIDTYIENEMHSEKGPHNSYLRMFLTTGILGGVSYVLFVLYVIINSSKAMRSIEEKTIVVIIIIFSLHQMFSSWAIFGQVGIRFFGLASSIFFGYGIRIYIDD